MRKIILFASVVLMSGAAWAEPAGDLNYVKNQIAKFAPVKIEVPDKLMSAKDKKVVEELVKASDGINEIFLRQVWDGNIKLREELKKAGKKDELLYKYFVINAGPYDRLEHENPFIDGVPKKPEGAGFYPNDITKDEFNSWVAKHPADKDAFEGTFTVIKRSGGGLAAMPYSKEYKDLLESAAAHLKKAASLTDNESLKKYLTSRADAFLSNDYFQSDVDWVHLKDHTLEVVIGPYEVYEDNLFGYKAAFESFITRVDPDESAKLTKVVGFMSDLQKHLPVEDAYKGLGRNLASPIVVAQSIYSAGDANRGVQTIAFNLPNDEKVRKEYGSKKVMLKNVQQAKFDKILKPIAKLSMRPEDFSRVSFDAFFAHTLLHEISHGIGPGEIKVGGKTTTVGKALKELYSTIEECKADTLGVYNNIYLIEKGLYAKDFADTLWATYLAGMFRSVRFGINEAHGGGNAIQFNYIIDKGGFGFDSKTGLFFVNRDRIEQAVKELAQELLMIEAKGDYKAAKDFVQKYKVARPELKDALARLTLVPVDITPVYAWPK